MSNAIEKKFTDLVNKSPNLKFLKMESWEFEHIAKSDNIFIHPKKPTAPIKKQIITEKKYIFWESVHTEIEFDNNATSFIRELDIYEKHLEQDGVKIFFLGREVLLSK